MDLAVGDETVLHTHRFQDVGRNVRLVLLTAHDFDHATEDLVVGVRVLPLLVGCVGRSDLCKLVDAPRKLVLTGDVGV